MFPFQNLCWLRFILYHKYIKNKQNFSFKSTFNIPDLIDRVLQGAGVRGAVGATLNESLPNIKNSFAVRAGVDAPDGLINIDYSRGGNTPAVQTLGSDASVILSTSADKSSSTYQDNAPVQQDALCIVYAVKY